MQRKKMVAGNWKMNKNLYEGKQLVSEILERGLFEEDPTVEVVIAPPFTSLELTAEQIKDHKGFYLAAQNCHHEASGAFTGEVSAAMLKGCGVDYVIIGHSERRQYFRETDEMLASKVNAALNCHMKVIFCCGEPLDMREAGNQNDFVGTQIERGVFHLSEKEFADVVIAYEPIWAIGTGLTASDEQAQEMHAFIRSKIAEKYGQDVAEATTILYGGSCKPSNAKSLFACPDVDGGLIGGASLDAKDFAEIVKARM